MRTFLGRLALAAGLAAAVLAPQAHAAATRYLPIRLPADARAHDDAHNEWWYFTGHLRDQQGRSYGYELVNFKFSHLRGLIPNSPVDTLYRVDLAITDESGKQFYSMVNYLPQTAGRTVLATDKLTARMPGPDGSLMLDTLPGPGLAYRIRGIMPSGAIDLQARTARPALLQGENGVEQIADGYSYYYTLTNMQSSGSLTIKGRRFAVSGLTWMDHQWGNWSWQQDKGWDWMAIQLSDGTSLSLVNFIAGNGGAYKYSAVSRPDGSQFFTRNARMRATGATWTSPLTGTTFPQGWHVQVPSLGLDATVTPTIPNQEMVDQFAIGVSYWEGSGRLVGTLRGKPITGLTYTELVGYGKRGALGF